MSLRSKKVTSPVGKLTLVASNIGLVAVLWENEDPLRVNLGIVHEDTDDTILFAAEQELGEYFQEQRRSFTVPLDPRGTAFQQAVWKALRTIPFGETRTYGQIAATLGDLKATRAVGAANGRNPLSIIVPCHRVLGATGKLTGFAGGLEAKRYLLQLEQRASSFQLRAKG